VWNLGIGAWNFHPLVLGMGISHFCGLYLVFNAPGCSTSQPPSALEFPQQQRDGTGDALMAGFMKAIETVNSAVRTLVAVVLVGMLGVAGWFGYSTYNANDLAMREKEREILERDQRISALEG